MVTGKAGDPGLDVGMGNATEPDATPPWDNMGAKDAGVARVGRRLEMGLAGQPPIGPLTDRDLRQCRVNVGARELRVLDAGQEPFGVELPPEALVALGAGWGAVVRPPGRSPFRMRFSMLAMSHRVLSMTFLSRLMVVLWTVGLLGEPEDEVGAPVADVAADLEAAGSGAEVAPVAQGAFGDAEEGGRPRGA